MKKILSLLLAIGLVLSFGTNVFAEEDEAKEMILYSNYDETYSVSDYEPGDYTIKLLENDYLSVVFSNRENPETTQTNWDYEASGTIFMFYGGSAGRDDNGNLTHGTAIYRVIGKIGDSYTMTLRPGVNITFVIEKEPAIYYRVISKELNIDNSYYATDYIASDDAYTVPLYKGGSLAEFSTNGHHQGYRSIRDVDNNGVLQPQSASATEDGGVYGWNVVGNPGDSFTVEFRTGIRFNFVVMDNAPTEEAAAGTLKVNVDTLNVRKGAGLNNEVVDTAKKDGTYNYYETKEADGYKWYRIGENKWVADNGNYLTVDGKTNTQPTTPQPVKEVPVVKTALKDNMLFNVIAITSFVGLMLNRKKED